MITSNFEIVVTSNYCPTPDICYEINTHLPVWIAAILLGSAVLIIREFFK